MTAARAARRRGSQGLCGDGWRPRRSALRTTRAARIGRRARRFAVAVVTVRAAASACRQQYRSRQAEADGAYRHQTPPLQVTSSEGSATPESKGKARTQASTCAAGVDHGPPRASVDRCGETIPETGCSSPAPFGRAQKPRPSSRVGRASRRINDFIGPKCDSPRAADGLYCLGKAKPTKRPERMCDGEGKGARSTKRGRRKMAGGRSRG